MYCKKCGAMIPDGAKFCSKCGEAQIIVNAGDSSSGAVSPEMSVPPENPSCEEVKPQPQEKASEKSTGKVADKMDDRRESARPYHKKYNVGNLMVLLGLILGLVTFYLAISPFMEGYNSLDEDTQAFLTEIQELSEYNDTVSSAVLLAEIGLGLIAVIFVFNLFKVNALDLVLSLIYLLFTLMGSPSGMIAVGLYGYTYLGYLVPESYDLDSAFMSCMGIWALSGLVIFVGTIVALVVNRSCRKQYERENGLAQA